MSLMSRTSRTSCLGAATSVPALLAAAPAAYCTRLKAQPGSGNPTRFKLTLKTPAAAPPQLPFVLAESVLQLKLGLP
jgi:hypothetical protein